MTQLSLEETMGNPKRKKSDGASCSYKKPKVDAEDATDVQIPGSVNNRRMRVLKTGDVSKQGPVVYWMSRDQRSRDNWALLYAREQALLKNVPVSVVFNLVDSFLEARARHFGFMLRGLRLVEEGLKTLGIPFFLLRGDPEVTIPEFLRASDSSLLVMDFSPLRIGRTWRRKVVNTTGPELAVHEVDAHNLVPVWIASDKLEYSARTIRNKIKRLLPEFLVEYPRVQPATLPWSHPVPEIPWDAIIEDVLRTGSEVPEVVWCKPGEDAALEHLTGTRGFISARLKNYHDDRNNPSKPGCLSDLSPYLHYGQLSPQRCALEVRKVYSTHTKAVDVFLEELIIRRELSDNYCYYQPNYDNIGGAWDWARNSLHEHAGDPRDHIYTEAELENAKTYDELWNAAQLEMVHYGKMHGFMRMYWAKKILEWTRSPEEALYIAIYLNDKYQLDGRDPNGYVGCMWSICGIHDQGWKERPVFGKIRYMNYAGCKRKFNVDGYIMYVNKLVAKLKKAKKSAAI